MLVQAVKAAGVRAVELSDKVETEDGAVAISTMHFAKGFGVLGQLW